MKINEEIIKQEEIITKYFNATIIFDNKHSGKYQIRIKRDMKFLYLWLDDLEEEETDFTCISIYNLLDRTPDELASMYNKWLQKWLEERFNNGKLERR